MAVSRSSHADPADKPMRRGVQTLRLKPQWGSLPVILGSDYSIAAMALHSQDEGRSDIASGPPASVLFADPPAAQSCRDSAV